MIKNREGEEALSGKIRNHWHARAYKAYPHLSINPINTLVSICKKLKEYKSDVGNKNFQPSNLESHIYKC